MRIPKVVAVHDLSCYGRCSLSVIMPILANLQIQVCPLPTAVLSSHLGGYQNIAVMDFTEKLADIYHNWQKESLEFDCFYSGYLASPEQIKVVEAIFKSAPAHVLKVIDPVMGDHGKLYSKYTEKMQTEMRKFILNADLITPNYTEACFLLNENYQETLENLDIIYEYLLRIANWGIKQTIITGVNLSSGQIANVGYNSDSGMFFVSYSPKLPVHYPGTGDIFTSVLLGYILLGLDTSIALQRATEFVYRCIEETYTQGTPTREGVLLEQILSEV